MLPLRPTELLHTLLAKVIRPGDHVIDATAGNGHDTAFLAQCVGTGGRVIATDIQNEAVESTANRLDELGLSDRVEIHRMSHCSLDELVPPESVSAIVFNLGYLPGADHTVTTETESTISALSKALGLLKAGGTLAVICYPGHPGGETEAVAVESFFLNSNRLRVAKYAMLATKRASPFLIISSKVAAK